MAYSLKITDQHGTRVEDYQTSAGAKRAADVLLGMTGIVAVEFRIHDSPMWTRFGKRA
jgi:hypothetical protein